MKQSIERLIVVNTNWLEGPPGQNADPQEYATVAMATTQLVERYAEQKETAGDTAVVKNEFHFRVNEQFTEVLLRTDRQFDLQKASSSAW